MNGRRVVVIGGGPAGLMAAGRAAKRGARVTLVEKNSTAGNKLLLSGKGRCNLTSSEEDTSSFISRYGSNGKFLHSPFSKFGPRETINFFQSRGVPLKVERGKRVFPASGGAREVLDSLLNYALGAGCDILYGCDTLDLEVRDGRIHRLFSRDREIEGDAFILCTGGKSFPKTGSTGDGYRFARKSGHTVITPTPALCPVKTLERWPESSFGITLRNVSLSLTQGGREVSRRFGELSLTSFGISGPIAMDMSKEIDAALGSSDVSLSIDLKPALSHLVLARRIKRDFEKLSGRILRRSLGGLLPSGLIPALLRATPVSGEKDVGKITNGEIDALSALMKDYRLTPTGLLGFDWAIVTSGGVALKEIDPRSMRSKIVDNLFFAGELINIDGPTGGFNLQMCWSTGHLAGESAADFLT